MILDYITHVNVPDGVEAMDYVRQFAVSKGWSQIEWRKWFDWEYNSTLGVNEWSSDSSAAYLCLQSSGYGSTVLRFKMALTLGRRTHVHHYFHIAGVSNTTYVSGDSSYRLHPYCQYALTSPKLTTDYPYERDPAMDLSYSTIDKMWIFGDDKWICAFVDFDGNNVHAFHFGQFEMFETAPTSGMVFGHHTQYSTSVAPVLYEHHNVSSTDSGSAFWPKVYSTYLSRRVSSMDFCYDTSGSGNGASHIFAASPYITLACNVTPRYSGWNGVGAGRIWDYVSGLQLLTTDPNTSIPNLINAVSPNTYSNRRVMMKPVFFTYDGATTYVPFCKANYYIIPWGGLSIGEILTYGTEQYVAFPLGHITDPYGVAIRIA